MGGGSSKKQQTASAAPAKGDLAEQQAQTAPQQKVKASISPRKVAGRESKPIGFDQSKKPAELQEEAFLSSCAEELEIPMSELKTLYESYCNLNKAVNNTSTKSGGKISLQAAMDSNEFQKNPFALRILEFISSAEVEEPDGLDEEQPKSEAANTKKLSDRNIDFKLYAKFMSVFMGPEENMKAKLTTIFLVLCRFGSRHDCLTNEHLRNLCQITDPGSAVIIN